jgi:POT family proton-dependent oligopeptide transporter
MNPAPQPSLPAEPDPADTSDSTSVWFGHPRGLATLFFAEMWERFSYYGMRALLILYMTQAAAQGGLGWDTAKAGTIYGWYTFGVYALCIPGGIAADRWLGHRRAVLLGGIVIALGHFTLALPFTGAFFPGLLLIVSGTGLLKPNMSTLVGMLYKPNDPRRDGGFSLYYMGINLGAFIAPLVCGTLGQTLGWHWGFAAAGVGMVLGLVQFRLGWQLLAPVAAPHKPESNLSAERSAMLTPMEWGRLGVIAFLFVFASLFWAAFEQAGSSLNLFADRYTRSEIAGRSFPSTWFQSLNPLYILLFAPVFSWLWIALGRREPSSPTKFSWGLLLAGLGFLLLVPASAIAQQGDGTRVSPMWLVFVFLFHTLGELCLSPVSLSMVTKLAPARLVGSIMGFWFLTNATGNKLGGWIASHFDAAPLPLIFGIVAAVSCAGGLVLLAFVKPLRRLMAGVH